MLLSTDITEKLEFLAQIPPGAKISLKHRVYHSGVMGMLARKWSNVDHDSNYSELENLIAEMLRALKSIENKPIPVSEKDRLLELVDGAVTGIVTLISTYHACSKSFFANKLLTIKNKLLLVRVKLNEAVIKEEQEEKEDTEEEIPSEESYSEEEDGLDKIKEETSRDTMIAASPIVQLGPAEHIINSAPAGTDFDTVTYDELMRVKERKFFRTPQK